MSKVRYPRHVREMIDYAKSLGLDPEVRLGAHYVMSWKHGQHHGRVIIPSTPQDASNCMDRVRQAIKREIRGAYHVA